MNDRGAKVKRAALLVGLVVATGLGATQPAAAQTLDGCADPDACGQPQCYFTFDPVVHVRPDRTRRSWIQCVHAQGARLTTAPDHVDISNIAVTGRGLYFDVRPRDGAPRFDTAVFEVDGPSAPIHVQVKIETIPLSENSPPVCLNGGPETLVKKATGEPTTVTFLITCVDWEDDAYVAQGAGPGVHLDAPKHVTPDKRYLEWRYRTATSLGDETTAVWATDELGARSDDLPLRVSLDPTVDNLTYCWSGPAGLGTIFMRPGVPRRFGILCHDIDGDPIHLRVSAQPSHGILSAGPGTAGSGVPGVASLDATYTPSTWTTGADQFEFTIGGIPNEWPLTMQLVPRPAPENGGGHCAYNYTPVYKATPAHVVIGCSDEEGDPLSAQIVGQPQHGKVAEPSAERGEYGETRFPIYYAPDPGYSGLDWVRLRVTDPYGLSLEVTAEIIVEDGPPPDGYVVPQAPMPPMTTPSGLSGRDGARKALGTRAVKQIRNDRGAEMWARSTLSRRELLRSGHAPAIVIFCRERCRVGSDAALASGRRLLRTTRRRVSAVKTAGQAHVVTLDLNRGGRAALRRARKPVGKFALSVRAGKGKAKTLRRSIRVGR